MESAEARFLDSWRSLSMREKSALEVLLVFLKLGLTSFGGPIAHLGYYREELIVRRRWLDDEAYIDLVALCQSSPVPPVAKSRSR
jgi:chromate transporter